MEAIVLLITYALTSALVYSDGAFGIMYRIRDIEWVKDFGLLECYLCTSFWVGLVVSLLSGDIWLIGWAWGGSVIVDKFINWVLTK